MPEIKVTVLVEVDGQVVGGFPYVQRATVEQVAPWNPYFQPMSAPLTYTAIPAPTIEVLQALVLRPDGTITVRFANQTDEGLVMGAGSLLIALGCDVEEGAALNATVFAPADTLIRGLAGGAAA